MQSTAVTTSRETQTETRISVPTARAELKKRRDLDGSICGWLGGQPELPALCAGASSCVRDTVHKYVGCCGTIGSCTAGFYTSCVDQASPEWSPPPSIQTNGVYTCAKDEECYRNTFAEDYYQFGCGKSIWATRVESTFTGQPSDVTLQLIYTAVTFPESPVTATNGPIAITSQPPLMTMPTGSIPPPSMIPEESDKTDPGAVAGIVIGVVNVFVIIFGLILCLFLRKRRKVRQRLEGSIASAIREQGVTVRNSNPMQRLSAISHIPKILPTPLRINPSLASYRSPHISRPILQSSPTSSKFSGQKTPLVSTNIEREDFTRFMDSITKPNIDQSILPEQSEWRSRPDATTSLHSKNLKSPYLRASPMRDRDDFDDDNTLEYHSVSGDITDSPHSRLSRPENDLTSSVSLMSDQEEMLATASIKHMTHVRRGGNDGYHLVNQNINNDRLPDPRNTTNSSNQF